MIPRDPTPEQVDRLVDACPLAEDDCDICGGRMVWVPCPTGGWWSHDRHPADEHDGVAPVPFGEE